MAPVVMTDKARKGLLNLYHEILRMRGEGHELHHITAVAAQVYNNEPFDVTLQRHIIVDSESDDAMEGSAFFDDVVIEEAAPSGKKNALKRKRDAAPATRSGGVSEDETDTSVAPKRGKAKSISTPTKRQPPAIRTGGDSDDDTDADFAPKRGKATSISTPIKRQAPVTHPGSGSRSGSGKRKQVARR